MTILKIYFAGSIRAGRDDVQIYAEIITILKSHGHVLTEHVGCERISSDGEMFDDKHIYKRDIEWIKECDFIVAEVTNPSIGVGFEIGYSQSLNKPILCMYREVQGKHLSAMISGNPFITIRKYTIGSLEQILGDYF